MGVISLVDIVKVYQGDVQALNGVNLKIENGDMFAILGPNGAGKSTLIGIIASLVNKTSGTVTVGGYDLDENPSMVRRQIGLVPQEFNLNVFEKVIDIMVTQAGYYGIPLKEALPKAEKWLKALKLWEKREEISRNLSGGMKRRLMIARALMHDPEIIILDEPTAGVDVEIRRDIWDFVIDLNKMGRTIILTTHYLEEVEQLCEKVAILNNGDLLENTTVRELISRGQGQRYLLDLNQGWDKSFELQGCKLIEPGETIEISVEPNFNLNNLFSYLEKNGYQTLSVRPKTNRIEELFLHVVDENKKVGS